MTNKKIYHQWLKSKNVTNNDKIILKKMSQQNIKKSFTNKIAFGTAGIRAHMGIGASLLNVNTIKMITYAWIKSLEIAKQEVLKKPLIIGHDVRKNSLNFAKIVAQVISGMGYKALMFFNNESIPTPIISFAIIDLKLGGGACITASHNPAQYNGFKCFTENGQHLMNFESQLIQDELAKININTNIPMSKNNISYLGALYEDYYLDQITKCLGMPNKITNCLKIVFSPQHGTSYKLGPKILRKLGFDVIKTPLQSILDENFSHTLNSNPENPLAFNEMIEVGIDNKAHLLLTTDSDGDRVAVGVLHQDKYVLLNGQDMAAIITYHLLDQKKIRNKIRKNDYIVKSIVTTTLIDKICKDYNVGVKNTLIGFKYLGEIIRTSNINTLLAIEESYGASLCPKISLDKDALQILPFIAKMTSHYQYKNMSLIDVLHHIYKKYGYYVQKNHKVKINSNVNKLDQLLSVLKKITNVGDMQVKNIQDFEKGIASFEKTKMIIITFDEDSWIAIRPSGTEPLIRFYFCISDKTKSKAFIKYKQAKHHLFKLLN